MDAKKGGVIARFGESPDFVEVDGWRRALEHAGVRARVAQQNEPYFGVRYILYVFQEDTERAARVLGWVADPSSVHPVYAEDAARRSRGAEGRTVPGYVSLVALTLVVLLGLSLLVVLFS